MNLQDIINNKIKRYSISDERIKEFVFTVSAKDLCHLAQDAIENMDSNELYDPEVEKVISIIAWGFAKQFLTDKQKWFLAGFYLYHHDAIHSLHIDAANEFSGEPIYPNYDKEVGDE